jgi:hypothetical protein
LRILLSVSGSPCGYRAGSLDVLFEIGAQQWTSDSDTPGVASLACPRFRAESEQHSRTIRETSTMGNGDSMSRRTPRPLLRHLSGILLFASAAGALAQGPGPEGGPFWELAPTASTPRVTGTGIQLDGSTLRLHDSEPAGWSIAFSAEEPIRPFAFHASDNRTNRIEAVVRGPSGACSAGPESEVRAQLQVAALEPVPQGQATIAGPCFGARSPGLTLIVVFIDAPPR